jgi:Asp-tRNA(Asn)/Glu-tRNA(Gln) amidotransferase A subunit family amidase
MRARPKHNQVELDIAEREKGQMSGIETAPRPETPRINTEMMAQATKVGGLDFTQAELELMVIEVNRSLERYEALRTVALENSMLPALRFDPIPPKGSRGMRSRLRPLTPFPAALPPLPSNLEELAFYPAAHLAQLVQRRQVTSMQLTEMYLARLKRYGPQLECVVTLTEELAREQAARADAELAAGRYRGPLHGIPWGAKDLLATKGIPTTWGAPPYQDQIIDLDATVVQRLAEAGAVLVAKLTMGSLAWGDVWFGGKTKSPWNLEEGSSGSSAGSGAATAAGLVGFAIGTETYGSIVSPSTQCGTTGLRPTFGRVSRYGAMALCWSLDKIGPMCRSTEDCALVFDAIRGPDGHDPTVVDAPFDWNPAAVRLSGLRIGYVEKDFALDRETKTQDEETLATLRELGARLIPIDLPDYPLDAMQIILWVEAAAAFDDLTRSNRDDLLVRQGEDSWPNRMRVARTVPAVEYLQANRVRMLVMQAMERVFEQVDVYVAPSLAGRNLWLTNATGHPAVVLPNGFRANGLPTTITFTGRLYDEATALAVAKVYQDATEFHRQPPPLFCEP